ncbi:proton-coupled folate transporter-like isoform X2 [Lampetra fluviatilis]
MVPSWARVITVEPLLFLYMTALFIQAPATQQIILQKVCWETYGTTEACVSPLEGDRARVVQTRASTLFLLLSLATNIPAMITASLLGTWSDRSPCMRRLAMALPCFGAAMASALLMLVSSSPELSVYWTLAAACISSTLGGYVTILLSVMSYLATVTSPDERPCRMGVLEAMIFMGGTVGGLVEGAAVAHMGFLGAFSIQLACNLLATLYALLCIASPAQQRSSSEDERQPICSEESEDTGVRATLPPMSCLDGLTTWKVVFRKRGERGRLVMLLLLAVSLLNMACIVGYVSTGALSAVVEAGSRLFPCQVGHADPGYIIWPHGLCLRSLDGLPCGWAGQCIRHPWCHDTGTDIKAGHQLRTGSRVLGVRVPGDGVHAHHLVRAEHALPGHAALLPRLLLHPAGRARRHHAHPLAVDRQGVSLLARSSKLFAQPPRAEER